MAEKLKRSNPLIIIFLTFSLLTSPSTSVTLRDLEAAIFALRANGFDLFANSIAVSELSFQLLTHTFNSSFSNGGGTGRHGFTFFAPPNSALFSLDMTTDAFTYVRSLRFHVIPRRFAFADLRNVSMSSKPRLETLVPGHVLSVTSYGRRRRSVSIDGVRIAFPDLYLSSGIAVHGLERILVSSNEEFYHRLHFVTSPPSIHFRSPAPSIDDLSPRIERILAPIDAYSPQYEEIPPFSQHFGGVPPPFDASSPQIEGVPSFSQEFEGIPPYMQDFDVVPLPMAAFSPEIAEARLPIDAFTPEFGRIPASYDEAFIGGSFDSISAPPNDACSPDDDGIPASSPSTEHASSLTFSPSIEHSSSRTLSPSNEHKSNSPVYVEWSGAEVLSPRSWLRDWSAPPQPFTVGEWHDHSGNVNDKASKKSVRMNHHRHHHFERGH